MGFFERVVGDRGVKIYYFKIEKENGGKVKSSYLEIVFFVYFEFIFGLILIRV